MDSMKKKQRTNYTASFLSGGCAGMAAKFVIAPFDRVKILFQVKWFIELKLNNPIFRQQLDLLTIKQEFKKHHLFTKEKA